MKQFFKMLNDKKFESFDVNALPVQNYSSGEISIFLLNLNVPYEKSNFLFFFPCTLFEVSFSLHV